MLEQLLEAINGNDIKTATNLIDQMNVEQLSVKATYDRIPLHLAAYSGHTEIIKLIVQKGVEINILDTVGYTPLFYAPNPQIAKCII